MVVAVAVCEFHIPGARSLKEKRRVVQRLTGRLVSRHRVSVAETDYLNLHQRCQLAVASVQREHSALTEQLDRIRDLLDSDADALLTLWDPQYLG